MPVAVPLQNFNLVVAIGAVEAVPAPVDTREEHCLLHQRVQDGGAREGEAAEDAGPDEGRVELQRVDEGLLPPAHRRRAEEKVLVDAVVGEEGRSADGVARVERGVQPLDRLPRA